MKKARYIRLVIILIIFAFSCQKKSSSSRELIQSQLEQLDRQLTALEQSQTEVRKQLEQMRAELEKAEKELEKNQARIQLSRSSLAVLHQLNKKEKLSWFEVFQNIGTLVQIGLLLVILWLIYWIREKSREQVSARRAEEIFRQVSEPKPPDTGPGESSEDSGDSS